MKKNNDRDVTQEKSTPKTEARGRFEVKEAATSPLIVSEFERAPLTDVNFGF